MPLETGGWAPTAPPFAEGDELPDDPAWSPPREPPVQRPEKQERPEQQEPFDVFLSRCLLKVRDDILVRLQADDAHLISDKSAASSNDRSADRALWMKRFALNRDTSTKSSDYLSSSDPSLLKWHRDHSFALEDIAGWASRGDSQMFGNHRSNSMQSRASSKGSANVDTMGASLSGGAGAGAGVGGIFLQSHQRTTKLLEICESRATDMNDDPMLANASGGQMYAVKSEWIDMAVLQDEVTTRMTSEVCIRNRSGFGRRSLILTNASFSRQPLTALFNKVCFHPDSPKRMVWMGLSGCVLMCDIIVVPLLLADLWSWSGALMMMHWLFIVFWLTDMCINFVTGFHVDSIVEKRPWPVVRNYLRGWFLVDATLLIADFTSVIAETTLDSSRNSDSMTGLTRMLKIAHFLRILRLRRLLEVSNVVVDVLPSELCVVIVRALSLLLALLMLTHFIACMWYKIGTIGAGADGDGNSWLSEHQAWKPWEAYVAAFHWALTQFTPATQNLSPVTSSERAFAILVVIVALVAFSTFLGKMTSAMSQLVELKATSYKEERLIRKFLVENNISAMLTKKMWQAYRQDKFTQSQLSGGSLDQVTQKINVPKSIQVHLRQELFEKHLLMLPIFANAFEANTWETREICSALTEHAAATADREVFAARAAARSALCVTHGHMSYESDHLSERMDVKASTWVSEAALWVVWVRAGALVTTTPSRWVDLDANAFRRIVKDPQADRRLVKVFRRYAELVAAMAPSSQILDIEVSEAEVKARERIIEKAMRVKKSSGNRRNSVSSGASSEKTPPPDAPDAPASPTSQASIGSDADP